MKKFVAILMVVMMLLAMAACSVVEPFAEDSGNVNDSIVTDDESNSSTNEESATSTETSTTESSTETSTVESTTKQIETTTVESTTKTKETTAKPAETTTAKPTTTAHTHNWNPVYKTVHHDAVTHTVHHDAEYKEEKTVKSYTVTHETSRFSDGKTFDPYNYNYNLDAYNNAVWNYQMQLAESDIECGYDCPAVTHTISAEVYNAHKNVFYTADPCEYNIVKTLVKDAWDEKVVDKAAYDEKVVDHYECSCGATK